MKKTLKSDFLPCYDKFSVFDGKQLKNGDTSKGRGKYDQII